MSWFNLDPPSIAARVRASSGPRPIPSLGASLFCGAIGFTLVSVAGFVPWAVFGRTLYRAIGEAGLYAVCALIFIGLSGLLLHRLIIGPGSLSRFYKLFTATFVVYSIAWIGGFMTLRGHIGGLIGLFVGTALMGWMLTRAFDAHGSLVKVVAALFIPNSVGYFVGGWIEALLYGSMPLAAKLMWGVCYGLGFGAGLGLAFYLCQARARALLATNP